MPLHYEDIGSALAGVERAYPHLCLPSLRHDVCNYTMMHL